ncbi:hypothetical protein H4R20_002778 [Coemansia guatemalensis]|uniref:Uncharacterized protein n=1 Tax=Coemansia guatemalensis TaxID=2761395 RepID=A0A9W8LUB8_9FUNG|nr:hypothetical protein H4R20_002778 [Coemansia guatemalensis]
MHDGITGTPLFIGIRVLRGLRTRSLMDDIKSLFYAILYALSYLSSGPDGCPGFELRENSTAAFAKIGLVSNRQLYLGFSGVKGTSTSAISSRKHKTTSNRENVAPKVDAPVLRLRKRVKYTK